MRWTIYCVGIGVVLAVGGFIARLIGLGEWASLSISFGGIMVVLATFVELLHRNRWSEPMGDLAATLVNLKSLSYPAQGSPTAVLVDFTNPHSAEDFRRSTTVLAEQIAAAVVRGTL